MIVRICIESGVGASKNFRVFRRKAAYDVIFFNSREGVTSSPPPPAGAHRLIFHTGNVTIGLVFRNRDEEFKTKFHEMNPPFMDVISGEKSIV